MDKIISTCLVDFVVEKGSREGWRSGYIPYIVYYIGSVSTLSSTNKHQVMAPNQEGRENKAADFLQLSKTKTLLQSDELYQVYNL